MSTKNLSVIREDWLVLSVTVTRGGVAIDLTNAKAWMTAKREVTDSDGQAVFQKTELDGIVISAPTTGVMVITVVEADTSGVDKEGERLVYDVQVKEASGRISTPLRGVLDVLPGTTDATA